MTKEFQYANRLLLLVAITSVSLTLSTLFHFEIVKYLSAMAQIYALSLSFVIIQKYGNNIRWYRARLLLLFLLFYPLVRIVVDSIPNVTNGNFKPLTDGLIIYGSYYELAFVGLAMAVLIPKIDGFVVLKRFIWIGLPSGIIVALVAWKGPLLAEQRIFTGQTAITNFFIPLALLAFQRTKDRTVIAGWISILLILLLSITIYSRSYTLVGFYFMIFGIINFFISGQRKTGIIVILSIFIFGFFYAATIYSQQAAIGGESISDKFQFKSLGKSLERFSENGDFVQLFFWEGNSRAGIIVDAFRDFDETDWVFGKGAFGTYKSFDTRSTIELGWAEELFRWGLIYVGIFILIIVYCRRRLRKGGFFTWNTLARPLSYLLLIRLLDGFIFGLPLNSVYNMLFFTGIMTICTYKREKTTDLIRGEIHHTLEHL